MFWGNTPTTFFTGDFSDPPVLPSPVYQMSAYIYRGKIWCILWTKRFYYVCFLYNSILPIRWGAGLMARRGTTRFWLSCTFSTNSSATSAREQHTNSTVRITLIPAAKTSKWWPLTLNWELAAGGHKVIVHFFVATFVSFSFFWK